MEAALAVFAERGLRGATTRAIAERAEVAELTLFRHFGSKLALLREAVQNFSPPVAVPTPTDDVVADLRTLLAGYMRTIQYKEGLVLRLISELIRHPDLLSERPPRGLAKLVHGVVGLVRHHQRAGRLWGAEPPEAMALAFVGPVLARFLADRVLGVSFPFDPERYVEGFLNGRQGAVPPAAEGARRPRSGR
ncbi:MAG: helix-turn-helix transcriptional regulator [Clostridia bacterium]|nr:helix-turn-helix transcriptional regulator [Clostridia bacterium]